jgi:hypothetical protein
MSNPDIYPVRHAVAEKVHSDVVDLRDLDRLTMRSCKALRSRKAETCVRRAASQPEAGTGMA